MSASDENRKGPWNTPDGRAAFLRSVEQAGFLPGAESREIPAPSHGLRSRVEELAARLWSLPVEDREKAWRELSNEAVADPVARVRLDQLSGILRLEIPETPVTAGIVQRVKQLSVLPPRKRAVRRASLLYERDDQIPALLIDERVVALELCQSHPRFAELEPTYLSELTGRYIRPRPMAPRPEPAGSTLPQTERDAPSFHEYLESISDSPERQRIPVLHWIAIALVVVPIVFVLIHSLTKGLDTRSARERLLQQQQSKLPRTVYEFPDGSVKQHILEDIIRRGKDSPEAVRARRELEAMRKRFEQSRPARDLPADTPAAPDSVTPSVDATDPGAQHESP